MPINTIFSTGQRKDKSKADQIKENNMSAGGGMAYGQDEEEKKDGGAFDDIVNKARENSAAGDDGGPRPKGVQDVKIILWGNGFQV